MRKLILITSLVVMAIVSVPHPSLSQAASERQNYTAWMAHSLEQIDTLKAGMTRADLRKLFKEDGGLSTRIWRRYMYRACEFIKIDVTFAPAVRSTEQPTDKILKISRPFLEWPIAD